MTQVDVVYEGDLVTTCVHLDSQVSFKTNAPKDVPGGKGLSFSPTDLVGTALGSCALTLMGMAAIKLNVDIRGARVVVNKEMRTSPRRIHQLTLLFHMPKDYPEEIKQALIKAAKSCPVHESLHPEVSQVFTFLWGNA